MHSTEIPDPQKIEEAFNIIMNSKNQQNGKEADSYLRNLEQNYPYILVSLLQIFENSQVFLCIIIFLKVYLNKFQALLLIKNVIVRNWTKCQIKDSQKFQNISEELKTHVKDKIVSFLGVVQDDKFKTEINLIISVIAKHDFPLKFQGLVNYFAQGLNTIVQSGSANSAMTYDLIVSLKVVQQSVIQNRNTAFKLQQMQFFLVIWNNLQHLWKNITSIQQQELQQNINNYSFVNKISKKLDRLLSLSIMSLNQEQDQEKIQLVFMLLLEKTAILLKNVQQQKLLQPNLKTLIHSLGNIQSLFSFSINQGFQDYLILLKLIIQNEWEDTRVLRTGLIGIFKILKSLLFFRDEQFYKKKLQEANSEQFKQTIQSINQLLNSFFQENMQFFIEQLIKIAAIPTDLSDEELIEQEEDLTIDDAKNEMQCPIFTICLICQDQLMQRFPEQFIQKITEIMQQLINSNFNASQQILESFFAILGSTPRLTTKLKVQPIQIQPVLQYLIKTNTIQCQRRFAFLCRSYCNCFSDSELPQILEYARLLLSNSQDQIVQYQTLMCIKSIIQYLGPNFDFRNVIFLEQVAPVIVKLLCNLQKSNILWPLLSLLEILIQKYSETNANSMQILIKVIENSDILILMKTKSQLLIGALCDMFLALFVSFPLGTNLSHLYKLAIILIDNNLDSKENNIFELLQFLLQEYDPISDNNQTGILFSNLYLAHEKELLEDTEFNHMSTILRIIEELLLLNLIQLTPNIFNLLQERLSIAQQIDCYDIAMILKKSCISLLETIILKQFDSITVQQNQQIIVFLIQELIKLNGGDQIDQMYYTIQYKNNILEILNRFLLKDIVSMIQVLNTVSISADSYFILWQDTAQHITNRGNRKINVISQLLFLKYLSKPTFEKVFQHMLSEAFPEIDYDFELRSKEFRDLQQQNRKKLINSRQSRLSKQFRNNHRKEVLQELCLYDETFNLRQFFFSTIQECMKLHNYSELTQIINIQSVIDKLNQLINEK
ncbi:unnamed protein product (macronuclear) [Paramecium tetraurelia]|uniref:Importin N-terminal domain-containing protein n=1 Tax=Paramecium tetraurelia TaxID=5888 RepID=A0DPG2_PARTE|nr:uncharacterized protein GSPATT00019111001 [Paramecium tetraurelia]CAK84929.1 unnamed protein product [Paramecium tetraurelia]|eukprot:XP_001452326.1 hypothetical protein (macronuclear) [Paramecium tetraurelia strain d4-2]